MEAYHDFDKNRIYTQTTVYMFSVAMETPTKMIKMLFFNDFQHFSDIFEALSNISKAVNTYFRRHLFRQRLNNYLCADKQPHAILKTLFNCMITLKLRA